MTLAERRRHLLQLGREVRRLPLTDLHTCGLTVALLLKVVNDALEAER